jgi:hypothetical protein
MKNLGLFARHHQECIERVITFIVLEYEIFNLVVLMVCEPDFSSRVTVCDLEIVSHMGFNSEVRISVFIVETVSSQMVVTSVSRAGHAVLPRNIFYFCLWYSFLETE